MSYDTIANRNGRSWNNIKDRLKGDEESGYLVIDNPQEIQHRYNCKSSGAKRILLAVAEQRSDPNCRSKLLLTDLEVTEKINEFPELATLPELETLLLGVAYRATEKVPAATAVVTAPELPKNFHVEIEHGEFKIIRKGRTLLVEYKDERQGAFTVVRPNMTIEDVGDYLEGFFEEG